MQNRGSAVRILSFVGIIGFAFASTAHAAVDRKAVRNAKAERVELALVARTAAKTTLLAQSFATLSTKGSPTQQLVSQLTFTLSYEKSIAKAANQLALMQNKAIAKYHATGSAAQGAKAVGIQGAITFDTQVLVGLQPGIKTGITILMPLATTGRLLNTYAKLASEAALLARATTSLASRPVFTIPPATAVI